MVLVAIDVGTSKVVALIGEVGRDGSLTIIGKGAPASAGIKKGAVINIDQVVDLDHVRRRAGRAPVRLQARVGLREHRRRQRRVAELTRRGRRQRAAQGGHPRGRRLGPPMSRARSTSRATARSSTSCPRGYVVDGQEGVKDPIGMSAIRLEVETHIVHAGATVVQNLSKCVQQAGVRIDELVAAPLASAEAVLSETERDLGVAIADIGAGTTDVALFLDGSPFHTAVLPLGGNNVTNDLAIGLKTSIAVAEDLKIRYGTCDLESVEPDEVIQVEVIGEERGRTVERLEVCSIIDARMREIFEKLGEEIAAAGHGGILPAGLVLTGGAAQLAGIAELGRDVLQMPVRVAAPAGVGGLVDHLLTPEFSTSIGLLMWGARAGMEGEGGHYDSAPAGGAFGRFRDWVRGLFP